jgi:tRNA threonylcarbamoyladenosine biosynthesis protein TsaB
MLSFDTCFGACSVMASWRVPDQVGGADASVFRFERLERGHAERLIPMIGEVMADAPFGFSDLSCIAVTIGPGTFTGQRVGIAAARSLSLATGAEVAPLSSLAVMAYTAAAELQPGIQGKRLAVAVDARRGEIYFQMFAGAQLAALGDPVLTTPEAAARLIGDVPTVAVGSGAETLAGQAHILGTSIEARLGNLEPNVRFIPPSAVISGKTMPRPLYLRPPDAKPQDGKALRRVS